MFTPDSGELPAKMSFGRRATSTARGSRSRPDRSPNRRKQGLHVDLVQTAAIGVDDPDRAVHVGADVAGEDDLVALWRPVAVVARLDERSGRGDSTEAGAVGLDGEQAEAVTVRAGTGEDERLIVRGVGAGMVVAADTGVSQPSEFAAAHR